MHLDTLKIDDTPGFPGSYGSADTSGMSIDEVMSLVAADKEAVDNVIRQRLHSDVVLVNQLGHYIISSGGKRLRPVLLLLSARAFDYQGYHHIPLAAVVEFIHTATLLHDDVVDASDLRRGKETANAIWGNEASVAVDLSSVLPSGASFAIYRARDLYGTPEVSGTYSGPVSVSVEGEEFATFVVVSTGP